MVQPARLQSLCPTSTTVSTISCNRHAISVYCQWGIRSGCRAFFSKVRVRIVCPRVIHRSLSPSGFTIEEASQLARYAGMSDKLQCFSMLGFDAEKIGNELSAQGIAQILWYFIEGFILRKQDYPISAAHNQLTQYVVDVTAFSDQVTFWRSNKSGRWWMEVPLKSRKKTERHKLIPCSYNDYLMACQDDLPERLLSAYRRFI